MKTSGVSSNQPAQGNPGGTSKAGQKDKTQKDFKEVLQQSGGKAGLAKRKPFFPPGKKGAGGDSPTPSSLKSRGQKSFDPKSVDPGRNERQIAPKMKRQGEGEGEAPAPVANPTTTATPSIQSETGVSKVQNPGLNINEIQSIVNKVQVGINEKGLPECRFEVETKNLGTLDLKVSAEKDQIRIEFVTEDANAQSVLEQNMKELQQRLQDKGLTLAETKFTPRDQQNSDQQQSSGGQEDDAYPPASPTGPKRGFSL
jgi:Flagellar hook-length control protein FliK